MVISFARHKVKDYAQWKKVFDGAIETRRAAGEKSYIVANIARRVIDPKDDGQNLQHFMSDSPWLARAVFGQIQTEIAQRAELDECVCRRWGIDGAVARFQRRSSLGGRLFSGSSRNSGEGGKRRPKQRG